MSGKPLDPPPPQYAKCYLRRPDGSEIIGWRVRDSLLGRSRYWAWSDEAKLPSRYTSAWQKAGVLEVFPVAWRLVVPVKISTPLDPIARREAEVMLRRAILTDGTTRRKHDAGAIESSWDGDWHNEGLALIDSVDLEIFSKFIPEAFDIDNYLIGMGWFARLNKKFNGVDYNREQTIAAFRAYGYSNEWIGDRREINVSRQRVSTIYRSVIDRVWSMAVVEPGEIRRIPRGLWQQDSDGASG